MSGSPPPADAGLDTLRAGPHTRGGGAGGGRPRARPPGGRRWRADERIAAAGRRGAVAHPGERNTGSVEVRGSSPLSSTSLLTAAPANQGGTAEAPRRLSSLSDE